MNTHLQLPKPTFEMLHHCRTLRRPVHSIWFCVYWSRLIRLTCRWQLDLQKSTCLRSLPSVVFVRQAFFPSVVGKLLLPHWWMWIMVLYSSSHRGRHMTRLGQCEFFLVNFLMMRKGSVSGVRSVWAFGFDHSSGSFFCILLLLPSTICLVHPQAGFLHSS